MGFIEDYCPHLEMGENTEKNIGIHFVILMLNLLVYLKIGYIGNSIVIEEMMKYYNLYKFVCGGITLSKRTISRFCNNYRKYICYTPIKD